MRFFSLVSSLLLFPLFVGACTSAGDRLEQGMELEMQGRFDEAVMRYVDALDKDPSMSEARDRLMEVGDSAVTGHLAAADEAAALGDPVGGANHFHRIDNLLASARTVGVRLPVPGDYAARRNEAFDFATESLLMEGSDAQERGQWGPAIGAFQRARSDFEPRNDQRNRALAGESESLLFWSEDDLEAGLLRSAYDRAAQVHALGWASQEVSLEAGRVMEEALARGQVELMALPAVVVGRMRDPSMIDLEVRVNDLLAQGPWRSPPPFVVMTGDYAVRDVVREATLLGTGLGPAAIGLLMRLVEADYGAWAELVQVEATEYDVDQSTRTVRTRDGRTTTYILEDGQRRLRAEARVIVVDRLGNTITDAMVVGTGVGTFRRGVYDGDVRQLNLDRREVDYFDRLVLEAQEVAIRQALAQYLVARLGAAVFDPVMARIP
jgi:hypothetical protein